MPRTDFKYVEELIRRAGHAPSERQKDQLDSFVKLLAKENERMNLTAITDPGQIEIKHLVDSLEAFEIILKTAPSGFRLIDIGSGAGFPGIPLKIMFPDNNFVLLDSLGKRISFLNEVKKALSLERLECVCLRAEDYKERESFDICTSRAVAKANVLAEYCLPFLKAGGICVMYKAAGIEEELKEAEPALEELGGVVRDIKSYSLPEKMGERSLVIIEKVKKTPEKYPRRAGKPKKSPIK